VKCRVLAETRGNFPVAAVLLSENPQYAEFSDITYIGRFLRELRLLSEIFSDSRHFHAVPQGKKNSAVLGLDIAARPI
jgi:hypothetical protein